MLGYFEQLKKKNKAEEIAPSFFLLLLVICLCYLCLTEVVVIWTAVTQLQRSRHIVTPHRQELQAVDSAETGTTSTNMDDRMLEGQRRKIYV